MTDEDFEAALAKCSPASRPMLGERLRPLSPAKRDEVMVCVLRYNLRGGHYAERVAATLRELGWTVTPPADFEVLSSGEPRRKLCQIRPSVCRRGATRPKTGHVRSRLCHDESQMEADTAERAALEKAHAEMPERFDRMAMDELLRTGAPPYRQMGWTVKPPRKQK